MLVCVFLVKDHTFIDLMIIVSCVVTLKIERYQAPLCLFSLMTNSAHDGALCVHSMCKTFGIDGIRSLAAVGMHDSFFAETWPLHLLLSLLQMAHKERSRQQQRNMMMTIIGRIIQIIGGVLTATHDRAEMHNFFCENTLASRVA